MGSPAFDTHAIVCPTCARPSHHVHDEPLNGLYTCPSCKTRIVVCWSGHFVCDPARGRHPIAIALHRRSQPVIRIVRDIGVAPLVGLFGAVAVGGLVLLGGFGQPPERPSSDPEKVSPIELQSPLERDDLLA